MVGSKQWNDKVKTTPKISLRTWQAPAAKLTTPAIRKIVREELEDH